MTEVRVTFNIGETFPADDPMARWIVSLSRALNDIRVAAEFAVRQEQPPHERLYFVRVLASHMREAVKIVILECRGREDVRAFVASLPLRARQAYDEIDRRLEATLPLQDRTLFEEIKRLRDDTFHYSRDDASQLRLEHALELAAPDEGAYIVADRALRAEYADVVETLLVHPFDGSEARRGELAHELHGAIVELIGPLSTFLHHAESHYLHARPEGVVAWPQHA